MGFGTGFMQGRELRLRKESADAQLAETKRQALVSELDTNIKTTIEQFRKNAERIAPEIYSTGQIDPNKANELKTSYQAKMDELARLTVQTVYGPAIQAGLKTEAEAMRTYEILRMASIPPDLKAQETVSGGTKQAEAKGTTQGTAEAQLGKEYTAVDLREQQQELERIRAQGEQARLTRAVPTTSTQTIYQDTTATRSDLQQDQYRAEQGAMKARELAERIKVNGSAVGIIGWGAEIGSKIFGQLSDAFVADDIVGIRQGIRALRESTLKGMSDDDRFNKDDRTAVTQLFPSDSPVESSGAAIIKLEGLADLLEDKAAFSAGKLDRKPVHMMTIDEIAQAVADGKLDWTTAERALVNYHTEELKKMKEAQ